MLMNTEPDEWEDPELERGDYEFTERKDREVIAQLEQRKLVEDRSRLLQALQACGACLQDDRIVFADLLEIKLKETPNAWQLHSEKFLYIVEKVLDKKALTAKILRVHIELLD